MNAEWLKTQFQLHPEKSKAALAAAIGLDSPAVSKILAGKRQIKAEEYVAMQKFFGLPAEAAGASRGKEGSFVLSPLAAGNAFYDGAGAESQEGQWAIPVEVISAKTMAAPEQIRIFQVREQTMAPKLNAGDYVLLDLSQRKPSPPGLYVISDGLSHLVRHCEIPPGAGAQHVRVSAYASNFQPQTVPLEALQIIGQVIARLEWL